MNKTLHTLALSNEYAWIAYTACLLTIGMLTALLITFMLIDNDDKIDSVVLRKILSIIWIAGLFSFILLMFLTDTFITHA